MSEQLLPCPFCGGEGDDSLELCANLVQCLECGARGPAQDGPEFACSAHFAVTEWNRRAERTRALSQLEAGKEEARKEAISLAERAGIDIGDDYDMFVDDLAETLTRFAVSSALTSPSPAPEAEPVACERWRLVPVDPTEKMVEYAQMTHTSDLCDADVEDIYRTMLRNAPTPAVDADAVIEAIAAERERQTAVEGWTAAHDDAHTDFSLAKAACIYAVGATLDGPDRAVMDTHGASGTPGWMKDLWPWDIKWWKPTSRRRDLIKAAALIIAEIERLDRALSLPPSADKGE